MAYVIFLEEQNGFIQEQFPTFEEAQSINEQYNGIIMTLEQAQRFVQDSQQQYQPTKEELMDLEEQQYLEDNRKHNAYCRSKRLLFSPKREDPIPHFEPFNSRPVGRMFHIPPINQQNFRPPTPELHIIRSRPIRRSY